MALFDETQALEDDFDLDEESILEIDGKREVEISEFIFVLCL